MKSGPASDDIGFEIKRRRHALNMTQADLAKRAGIHVMDLSRYENARVIPRSWTLAKIRTALRTAEQ